MSTTTISIEEAIRSSLWDDDFWDAMQSAEADAREALLRLWDDACEEGLCACDTCVVRVVLEAVFPRLTEQFSRILDSNGGCNATPEADCPR